MFFFKSVGISLGNCSSSTELLIWKYLECVGLFCPQLSPNILQTRNLQLYLVVLHDCMRCLIANELVWSPYKRVFPQSRLKMFVSVLYILRLHFCHLGTGVFSAFYKSSGKMQCFFFTENRHYLLFALWGDALDL